MPCPFFEPQDAVEHSTNLNARLPLIAEYSGLCHALQGTPVTAPEDMRFGCNHGYSRDKCTHFPLDTIVSAFRYSVLRHDGTALDLVCIEEAGYAPVKWHAFRYIAATDTLDPQTAGKCITAQVLAFCRSYLRQSTVLNVK